jgi:NTE family protein
VDTNDRLARASFRSTDIPENQQAFPLGLAVAASACVPGIFHPLAVNDVYTDWRVQLVDGGVQDNQGVQARFDRHCSHLIVSDASHQMPDLKKPAVRTPAVLTRSLSIANDRIRDEQLVHSHTSGENGPPALMHLRKGLPSQIVQPGKSGHPRSAPAGEQTTRGVDVEVQKCLARMRTDLDYVSEYEAYSLGLCGYLMTADELEDSPHFALAGVTLDKQRLSGGWDFAAVEGLLARPSSSYRKHMKAAASRFLRAFQMFPEGPAVAFLFATWLVAGVILLLGWKARDHTVDLVTAKWPSWAVLLGAVVFLTIVGLYAATGRFRWARVPSSLIFGCLGSLLMLIPALIWSWLQLAARPLMLMLGRVPKSSDSAPGEVRGAQLSPE